MKRSFLIAVYSRRQKRHSRVAKALAVRKKAIVKKFLYLLLVCVLAVIAACAAPSEAPKPPTVPPSAETAVPTSPPTPAPEPTPKPDSALIPLDIYFFDVGQGDAILIDYGSNEVLIDGGDKASGIVKYLRPYVDGNLEVIVATHPHADHIGGLTAVLDAYQVDAIWLNGDTSSSETFAEFMSAVNREGATLNKARRGQQITINRLVIDILNPRDKLFDKTNNNSIVLRLPYEQVAFLFTGDAEQEAEASILGLGVIIQADILKVGHHGSRTASSKAFLAQVQPEAAIYMAGVGNRYGHPHVETILALQAIGAEIYGTDTSGTILITTDGKSYEVHTEK